MDRDIIQTIHRRGKRLLARRGVSPPRGTALEKKAVRIPEVDERCQGRVW